jgi:RNA polymerase sigma-70 factor (ECF subfamily)
MKSGALTHPETWLAEDGDYLFRYACVRLRNRAAAEDVMQETLLAAIRSLDHYDGPGFLSTGAGRRIYGEYL